MIRLVLIAATLGVAALAVVVNWYPQVIPFGIGRDASPVPEVNQPETKEEAAVQPVREDVVLVEIDGVVNAVLLPSGQAEPRPLPARISKELRMQPYQGLDPRLQSPEALYLWYGIVRGDTAFGRLLTPDGRDVAPMYVCAVGAAVCRTTDLSKTGMGAGEAVLAPAGAVSPSGKFFALVNLHDQPYIETGSRWELLLYKSEAPEAPASVIDITATADRRLPSDYDAVTTVAWSPDESQLAVGTNRKISLVSLDSGRVATVYEALLVEGEDEPLSWDSSLLTWSPSGRYLAFADYSGTPLVNTEEDEEVTDVLRVIDLGAGNSLFSVLQGKPIQLVTAD